MKQEKNHFWLSRDSVSVRWKLAFYMSLFVAIVLIITWVFQVFLLDIFYRSIKKNEMEETARKLAHNLESEETLKQAAFVEAADHSLCVVVYRIQNGPKEQVINIDATGSNVVFSFSENRLHEFYRRAVQNNGTFSTKIALGGVEVHDSTIFDQFHFPFENGQTKLPSKNIRLLYVTLTTDTTGTEYMIVLDSNIQPLDATVQTLANQYLWIAMIVLAVAVVMVLLLYRKISAPLIRMNESAKQLALGHYDVRFSEEGYLETKELAETLNYASHELSKLDHLQKELIANISHDLRTPLTMIRGYGEIMRDLPGENTPENMQALIDETTRLTELVNDLLDLSKLQSGAREPQIKTFHLTEAVREIMTRYDTLIKHRGYHVSFVEDGDAFVAADRGMILQVLYNLINNAINYTGEDQCVIVKQEIKNGKVRISVTDTGEGIAPEEMPLIWDRYYKVDKIHKRAMIGTGLGLSIVKGILELHHAAYGVNSTIGQGSTFWFELPIEQKR